MIYRNEMYKQWTIKKNQILFNFQTPIVVYGITYVVLYRCNIYCIRYKY